MITAKIIDNIWATRKADCLNGLKFMQAEIIGGGIDTGKKIIVVARRMLGDDNIPVDAVVVGIIDEDCDFE